MPSRASVSSRSVSGIGQFLSDSGSIDGGMRNIGQASGRVKAAIEKIVACSAAMAASRYFQTARSGREASMWHRHTQRPTCPGGVNCGR